MKKLVPILLILMPMVSVAEADLGLRIQILDNEIEQLTNMRDEKYEALKKCEKSTQGFKIAGLTTLVATGVGVYGNVKLAQKLKGGTSGGGKSARIVDNRSQEEKNDDSCTVLCDAGIGAQAGCDC